MPFPPINKASAAMRYISMFKAATAAEATHQCLAGLHGGKFKLNAEQERLLWSTIQAEMFPWQKSEDGSGERDDLYMNYLIEKPPSDPNAPRPPYFDFDFHLLEELSIDEFCEEVLRPMLSEVVGNLFPDVDSWKLRAVVSSASSKTRLKEVDVQGQVEKEKVQLIKSGFHVLFPEMLLSKSDAAAIRLCVVDVLEKKHGHKYCHLRQPDGKLLLVDTWHNIVDPTVFTANGLKMLGSHKVSKCAKHDKNGFCKNCNGFGRIDEGRPYSICAIVGGRGEMRNADAERGTIEKRLADRWRLVNDNFAAALEENTIHRSGDALCPKFEEAGFKFGGEKRKMIASVLMGGTNVKRVATQTVYDHTSHLPGVYFSSNRSKDSKPFIVARKRTKTFLLMEEGMDDGVGKEGWWRLQRDGERTGTSLWAEMGSKLRQIDIYVPGLYNNDERFKQAVPYSKTFPEFRAVPEINFCPNVARAHTSNRVYFHGHFNPKARLYEVKLRCFSNNQVPGRTNCREATQFFQNFRFTMPPIVAKMLLQIAEIPDSDVRGTQSFQIQAPEPSQGPPPADLARLMASPSAPTSASTSSTLTVPPGILLSLEVYQRAKAKALELGVDLQKSDINLCYGCHSLLSTRDKTMRDCKCETPLLAPNIFTCHACKKLYNRRRRHLHECECDVSVYK